MSALNSESVPEANPPSTPLEENSPSASVPPTTDATGLPDGVTTAASGEPSSEGLPEWEPLTPELVEDEAIRGDFMLRWATVFLALLFGCRQITETTTLLHVKTGQYLAAHGVWPPKTDVFSATATDRPWINLAWFWDLISAGLFSVGEGIGLSLGTALLVAATWWLLGKTSRTGVSTWWGSILGVLTLLACHPRFSGQPETVTLFGLAATLWVLHAWQETVRSEASATTTNQPLSLWWLVPGFVVWSNLDNRMFLGLFALLLWGLGDTLGNACGRGTLAAAQRRQFWMVFAACVGASLLNPFGWQALAAPLSLYGTEYPAVRTFAGTNLTWSEWEAFPLLSRTVSARWGQSVVCGSVVVFAAALMLGLNFRKASLGDATLLLGMSVLPFLAVHELAAAAVVACAIGSLNGQQWYQANFRQSYSIELRELLFTRGGRAVTVLAFFVLAVLAVNQSVFTATGKRMGLGLSADLRAMIDGYRTAVAESFDDRPFNFVPLQGDVLIWLDQKPFVDSRVGVFARGEENLLALHDRTRRSLAAANAPAPSNADSAAAGIEAIADAPALDEWKGTFERFRLTHVIPRLVGVRPVTYFRLLLSPDWQLTHLGSMCAVLYHKHDASADLEKYLGDHRLQFVELAMQTDAPSPIRTDWPRPRTTFQKYVSPPDLIVPNSIREADNLMMHVLGYRAGQLPMDEGTAAAMAMLAIRKANEGLSDSADQPTAYRVLAEAYSFFDELETSLNRSAQGSLFSPLRFNQALAAYHQAVLLEPSSAQLRFRFMEFLNRHNRIDLALRELEVVDRLTESLDFEDADAQQIIQRIIPLRELLQSRQDQLREQLKQAQERGESAIALSQQVYQAGFVLEALSLLDSDPVALRDSPPAQALRGLLLFESGQVEAAYTQFEYGADESATGWRVPAAWTRLAHADYDRAIELWTQQRQMGDQAALTTVLFSLPLLQSPFYMAQLPSVWPAHHLASVGYAESRWLEEKTVLLWYTALSQLEAGRVRLAGKTLSGLLELNPETTLRPLVRFYLYLITSELIDYEPPSEWIPIHGDMFAPDEPDQAAPTAKPEAANDTDKL